MTVQGTLVLFALAAQSTASTLYSTYNFNPLEHLAGISPYFEPQDPPLSPDAPIGCTAERAAYLIRHAAIYANDFDYEEYIEPFLEKLENTTNVDWAKIPPLNFLADWSAPISEAESEILTRVGKLEATQLGVDLEFRYPNLRLPQRVWTSSAERTWKSAQSLVRGLELDDNTINVVNVSESEGSGANSLTPYKACPAYSSSAGSDESSVFQERYAKPIIARFNNLAPNFNFTVSDVFAMQQICGYETVIRGKSPFCSTDLFTPDDWLGWEYAEDVRYHYNVGYGNNAAGYVGLPWFNATANLLLEEGDIEQDLYVSFTHRELPPMVLVAMGLFNNSEFGGSESTINSTMPLDRINHARAWKSSNILPFLTNIAIERFNCTNSFGYDDGDYYRVLVNSSPQQLPDCNDGPATTCSKDAFQTYLQDRVNQFSGFSKNCGKGGDNSTADLVSFYAEEVYGNGTLVGK
ncbi:unnamed protein product [Clonostachys rosea]|uniref:Acid phosphatase n=1 Tax=Bionectria ochroleuca TaxID=29856 RepID=A0ABY6UCY2_BIOOC|nr:unnamed protein product [Clonostachys rosea]